MVSVLFLLLVALGVLTTGAELLVRGSVALARRMGVSSFFIGLTIVGFGTSTPELSTSLLAGLQGMGDIAVGNVVGSNIFNIACILGVAALIAPIPVQVPVVRAEVRLVILVAAVPLCSVLTGGRLPPWFGAACLCGLAAYIWRGYRVGKLTGADAVDAAARELEHFGARSSRWRASAFVHGAFILAGLVLLVLGSKLFVSSAVTLARALGVSDLVIGLTIVSAGTSMPELVTSVVAAFRKEADLSVGNILGSNIFNVLGILGLTTIVAPQRVAPQVLYLDTPVMLLASVALAPIATSHARISRAEGLLLLAGYVAYVVILFRYAPQWFGTS